MGPAMALLPGTKLHGEEYDGLVPTSGRSPAMPLQVQAVSYSHQQEESQRIMDRCTFTSYQLQIELCFAQTQQGDLFLMAHIELMLQTDASILYLEGTELSFLQLNTNKRLCVAFNNLSKLRHHHKRWHLTCSHFVVNPNQEYGVTVHHLPKPISDGAQTTSPIISSCLVRVSSQGIPSPLDSKRKKHQVAQMPAPSLSKAVAGIASNWDPQNRGQDWEFFGMCCSLHSLRQSHSLLAQQWTLAQEPTSFMRTGVPPST
ncbi:hypothetical protein P7K49_014567 [Saguinus oedipus]|uniref:IL17RA/B N-terminal domain-containing protein n=1 Tax=Saguinus oedipus TaxID=9490 RepID=A0ABQ9V8R2_SAGOE|nr:hypothetical protein P7K49_014567 [Saguinus oedipus]